MLQRMDWQDTQPIIKYIPPQVTPQNTYPAEDTPGPIVSELAAEIGVTLDPELGLTLPNTSTSETIEFLNNKIATNLTEVRARIEEAKALGKHIVYMPGSYDLTHKGHAFYVEQVVECYLSEANCSREDIFVVMLADSDKLIADVKASKYVGNGGTELQPRPVEPAAERVIGMAALNVDLVGILPSSQDNREVLPEPIELDIEAMIRELNHDFVIQQQNRLASMDLSPEEMEKEMKRVEKDKAELLNGLTAYQQLIANFRTGADLGKVPVQAWQLYTTSFINSVTPESSGSPVRYAPGHMTRLVSKDDTKYLSQVIFLMTFANVAVSIINDINNGSTSKLLEDAQEKFGAKAWDAIRESKTTKIAETFGEQAAVNMQAFADDVATRLAL